MTVIQSIAQIKDLVNDNSGRLQGVCFDYFDTLVTRSISPEYVKVIAAEHLVVLLDTQLRGQALYEIRRGLEISGCEKNMLSGCDPEFDLCTLARELYSIISIISGKPKIYRNEETFIDIVLDLEVAIELQVQILSQELTELISWIKGKGINTYLISDFYIPGRWFNKMLKHHGLEDVFSDVFISTDYGATKSSGKLYEKVLEKIGCHSSELVMIGDNAHSDWKSPRDLGIHSHLIDTTAQKEIYAKWQCLHSSEQQRKNHIEEEFNKLVKSHISEYFPEISTTLWLFTEKLFHQLLSDGRKSVFFCSKEGEFLEKIFNLFQEIVYGRRIIDSHYLLVSRKATFICSLRNLADEDFHRLFDHYRDLSIEEFLLSLNFSCAEVKTICSGFSFDYKRRYFNLRSQPEFAELIDSRVFREKYEAHRSQQKKHFLLYLESFNEQLEHNGLALVDVGWKGSIQNNIFYALDKRIAVSGYYIGLLSPTDLQPLNTKRGIVFSDFPEHSPFIHVYNNNRSLFEMMLGASHGSADGYFSLQEFPQIQAERKSTVFQTATVRDESIGITVLDLPAERELYLKRIKPLQNSIIVQFEKLTKLYAKNGDVCPDLEWFARQHARMVFQPTVAEIDFYSNLYHLENFGLFEFTRFGVEESPNVLHRVRNFIDVLKNTETVLETGVWPPIIFRKKGLLFLQKIDGFKRHRRFFQGGYRWR